MVLAMMEDVNNHPSVNNTLEEVKKLQDLVRKLELQNQQLRNKQNKLCRKTSQTVTIETSRASSSSKITNCYEDAVGRTANNANVSDICDDESENENRNYLDEIDLIKVSDVDISDDESWLYTSPRGLTPEQRSENPYKWLRKDLDDPNNRELQLAKKALVAKLNEFDILSSSPSQRNIQRFTPIRPATSGMRKPVVPCKVTNSNQETIQYSVIDTRTFTKSKKRQALDYLSPPTTLNHLSNDFMEQGEAELCRRGSDVSLDSSTGTYTLTDANDVHEVARLQEESLRFSSPVGTPKRQSGPNSLPVRKLSASSRSSISDMDNTENVDIPSLNSVALEVEDNPDPINCNTVPGRLDFSDQSSPSESPYGSNASLDNTPSSNNSKVNSVRRSMPNLNRSTTRVVPKPSKALLASEQNKQRSFALKTGASGRRSDSNLLASSKSKQNTSVTKNKFKSISHYVSPTSSTAPVPVAQTKRQAAPRSATASRLPARSGLPRPARAASATRTSGIPMPSSGGKKPGGEESWSDGCF